MLEKIEITIGKKYSRDELGDMGIHCLVQRTCGVACAIIGDKKYEFGIRAVVDGSGCHAMYKLNNVAELRCGKC